MAIGRHTKLTPEVQDAICANLAEGIYVETACILAGVCKATFYKWKTRGEAGEQPYVDFVDAVTRAEAEAERRAIAHIQRAGEEDPRHLEWWLERKHSDRWARREKHEVSGPGGGPQEYRHTVTSVPEVLANPQAAEKACELEDLIAGIAPGATDPGGLCEED